MADRNRGATLKKGYSPKKTNDGYSPKTTESVKIPPKGGSGAKKPKQ